MWMIFKGVFLLVLIIIAISVVLYFLMERRKNRLVSLYKNPKEFIINLYENAKVILSLFGLKYEDFFAPLSYADLVEKKCSVKDSVFLRLTAKFEEAKYSRHILQSNNVFSVPDDYNNFLKILVSNYNKFKLFFRYCLTLLHKIPFHL